MDILKIILCLVFPPVAAFLQVGATKHLWINIVLSICGYVPGVVHAFWLVLGKKTA